MVKISSSANKKIVIAGILAGSLLELSLIRGNAPISTTPKKESGISVNYEELQKMLRKEAQQEKRPLIVHNDKNLDNPMNTLKLKEKKLASLLLSESNKNKALTEKAHELKLSVKYNSNIILSQYVPVILISTLYGAVFGVTVSLLVVMANSDRFYN